MQLGAAPHGHHPLYAVIMDVRPSRFGAADSPEGNMLDMYRTLVRHARACFRVPSSRSDRTVTPTSPTGIHSLLGRERHGPPGVCS